MGCSVENKTGDLKVIMNDEPKYSDKNFVTLEKLYNIDILETKNFSVSQIGWMDTDDKGNLYALSNFEKVILVFDNKGNYLKTLGNPGQGPGELERPNTFFIRGNNIYIYENYNGLKIWDLDGNHIDYLRKRGSNPEEIIHSPVFRPLGDEFLCSYYQRLNSPDYKNMIVNNKLGLFSEDLSHIKTLASLESDPLKYFNYKLNYVNVIDSERNTYFPVDPDKYIITKYNLSGDVLLSFGRKYERERYSKESLERYAETYGRPIPSNSTLVRASPLDLPDYPPIVKHIMIDGMDNVWVIIGEWYSDGTDVSLITSTIDIFNKKGEFLYTFKSHRLSQGCFIKTGRLYTKPLLTFSGNEYVDYGINVYKVHYNFDH